ncbi:MAG: serine hydroxymethyltransferase [Patescibacteria group bacterium]
MTDQEIERLIKAERARQKRVINLIPSENYVSKDVLAALGSELNNKYAEGYPGKRYYGGNAVVDEVERLCQKRALKLFKLNPDEWAVNVQALSGSPANLAVYYAMVPPHGKIMGMSLDHGGHLTHGHKVSLTGKIFQQIPYGVSKETELLDYEELKKIARANKPDVIVAGFTAYPRIVDWEKFRDIADACGALFMVDMSHFAGLVAGGVYPSPFKYADVVTTTTHKTLRGPRSALIFSRRDKRELDKKIDKAVFPGLQGGPHLNQIAAVAVALQEAIRPEFRKYAQQIVKNAKALGNELQKLGWRLVSGGTDSHLLLVDTWSPPAGGGKGIGGKEASDKLEKAGIIVNKNMIPFDTRTAVDPSGIRLGTPAETTRGKKEREMVVIARKIDKILRA